MRIEAAPTVVYWHKDLPPLGAEPMGEYTVEASSQRIAGTQVHRDELWSRCYAELMSITEERLAQEMARLGGNFAHVHGESIDEKHDHVTGETWLHGRFTYVLYRAGTDPETLDPTAATAALSQADRQPPAVSRCSSSRSVSSTCPGCEKSSSLMEVAGSSPRVVVRQSSAPPGTIRSV